MQLPLLCGIDKFLIDARLFAVALQKGVTAFRPAVARTCQPDVEV